MITDAIIRLFSSVIDFIINLLPDAPIIATGNGAASGFACCAAFAISAVANVINTSTVTTVANGSFNVFSTVSNSPIWLLIDWQWLGFAVGCLVSMFVTFLIIRILLIFWQQVKW
jgi:hypothetical protein